MDRKQVMVFFALGSLLLAYSSHSALGSEETPPSLLPASQLAGRETALVAPPVVGEPRSQSFAFAKQVAAIDDKCRSERCYGLRAAVRQHGFVTVSVELSIPNLPDETLTLSEYKSAVAQARRRAIARAQANLIRRMAPLTVNAVIKYTFSPGMEMMVDAKGLEDLIENTDVKYIRHAEKKSGPCGRH